MVTPSTATPQYDRLNTRRRRRTKATPKAYNYYLVLSATTIFLLATVANVSIIPDKNKPFPNDITSPQMPSSKQQQQQRESLTISSLKLQPRDDFVSFLGSVYEHSPWVAERLYDSLRSDGAPSSINSLRELTTSMKRIVDESTHDEKLTLLRAHPDLALRDTSALTAASREEQSRVGAWTDEERSRFSALNQKYRERFDFPFILAVRNATKYTVLSAVASRVGNTPEVERGIALSQVHKIARMRLLTMIELEGPPKGYLTCHVLDTANGRPAAGMRVRLFRLTNGDDGQQREFLEEFVTNDDGRLPGGPALKGEAFRLGVYEYVFFVGDYFAGTNLETGGVPFLDEVPIRFGIDDAEEHYHVPLLVSPYSFSTYRGS